MGKAGDGVIWLEEVTMRYGGEEGRLFDTAIRWCYAVMYNGNTSKLSESRMACTNYARTTHKHIHTEKIANKLNLYLLPYKVTSSGLSVFSGLMYLFDHCESITYKGKM